MRTPSEQIETKRFNEKMCLVCGMIFLKWDPNAQQKHPPICKRCARDIQEALDALAREDG